LPNVLAIFSKSAFFIVILIVSNKSNFLFCDGQEYLQKINKYNKMF